MVVWPIRAAPLHPVHNSNLELSLPFARLDRCLSRRLVNYIVTVLNQLPLKQLTTLSILNSFVRSLNTGASNDYLELLTLINSCLSLKRLDIRIVIDSQLSILAPTFARLELFSCSSYEPTLIGHFNPKCSQVSLSRFGEDVNFDQWHTINGQWLMNVTPLNLKNVCKHDRVIDYLSQHAISLQVLCLDTDYYYQITSQVIGHLSKLKHLTEIELSWVSLDTPQLEEAARKFELIPLVSIRSFTLANSTLDAFSGENTDRFTKILCIILPNVQKLNLMCNRCFLFPYDDIVQYLHRYPKLRTVLISSGTITIPKSNMAHVST